ncbi:hypothetical protein ACIBCO_40645 [Streptomyces violascens]|uniref:hypothetical protein n=1 Tax=Streptomyces violascens TaxID=67381 RepID=UPI0037937B29
MIRRVGFYHDDAAAASRLRDTVRSAGESDEQQIIGYLDSGTEIYSTMGAERDVVMGEEWISGAGSLVTDGTWLWPVELVHYLRRYHIALPADFVEHIRGNQYVSPNVTRQRAIEISDEYFKREEAAASQAAGNPASRGFFTWYASSTAAEVSISLVRHLETSGLSVVHPLTENAFGYGELNSGPSKPLLGGRDMVVSSLADEQYAEVTFQCWMGYDISLTGTVHRLSESVSKISFLISDVPVPDRENTVAALVRTLDQDLSNCLGFVIDRLGVSNDQDWDRILLTADEQITVWPDTVGIQRHLASAHNTPTGSAPADYGPLLVFQRP